MMLLTLGYLLFAAAVMIAWRVGTRGRVDWFGCLAVGLLWPASVLLALWWGFVLMVQAWVRAIGILSPPAGVCAECGLCTSDVSIAGVPQARCTCGSGGYRPRAGRMPAPTPAPPRERSVVQPPATQNRGDS